MVVAGANAGVDDLHKLLVGDAVGRRAELGVLRNSEQLSLEVVPAPAPQISRMREFAAASS